jgi:hypothetical protein
MDSLFFPAIKAREESIAQTHRDTFQWIFEENAAKQTQPWSNFIDWLRNGQGI